MKKIFFATLSILLFAGAAQAQLPVLPVIRDTLYSNILKESRPLEIVLPAGYNRNSPANASVIYVTDGEWNRGIVASFSQFLGIQFIPPQIVVGIDAAPAGKENLRFRDLTPSADANVPGSGGGALFLAFIKQELIPYINRKYPNKQENTLFGASLGGLFGVYALLKEPTLFNAYLLADPSLFWNGYAMQKLAASNPEQLRAIHAAVMLTGRQGQPFRGMGIAGLDSVLRQYTSSDLHLKTLAYTDETHNSMIFRTVYDGLKLAYQGFYASHKTGLHPGYAYLDRGKPLRLYTPDTTLAEIRYTTDGSQPNRQSKKLSQASLEVNTPTEFRFTSFAGKAEYDTTVSAHFAWSPQFKPESLPKNKKPGGLHFLITSNGKKISEGTADSSFHFQKIKTDGPFTCVMTGYFEAKSDGYYALMFDTPDDLQFTLGGKLLLDHPDPASRNTTIPLKKGFYPVRLTLYHQQGEKRLNLFYEAPESIEKDRAGWLPLTLLYH